MSSKTHVSSVTKSQKNRIVSLLTLETKSAPKILMGPIVVFLLAITVFPTVYALYISSHNYHLADPLGRKFVGLGNFMTLFTDPRFWNAFKNTSIFMGGSLILEIILGFILALLIAKNFRGSSIVKSVFLLPTITTPVVVGLIWIMLYDPQFGIINYVLSFFMEPQAWLANERTAIWALVVVDVWEWSPFVALVLLAGLQSLPNEPYEAAEVDGASKWMTFLHLTLPLMKPYILIALIFRFMDLFRWFDTIYVMTKGGPGTATETLNMFGYLTGFEFLNMGYAAAIGIVMLIVIIIVSQTIIKRVMIKE